MSQEQPPLRNRRELRRARDQRLEANQKPGTPGSGAVPPASSTPGGVDPGEPTEAEITGRRRYAGPVDSIRAAVGSERSPQVRARGRAASSTVKDPAEKEANLSGGGPLTRRQLRLLQLAAETAQPAPGQNAGTAGPSGQGPKGMTVEQALAAREMLARQAHNQLAKMAHINATDPDAVDPGLPAGQTALAERAAVLNGRTDTRQVPAEQQSKPEPVRNDPANASNLAMVTPLEFVRVPGVDRPVMKRPATSHVPVVTTSIPRVEQPRKSGDRPPGPARTEGWVPAAPLPEGDFAGRRPVAASTANGLEPLDADTAGLGRARRRRLVQLAVLALGVIALIAGSILVIAGLTG